MLHIVRHVNIKSSRLSQDDDHLQSNRTKFAANSTKMTQKFRLPYQNASFLSNRQLYPPFSCKTNLNDRELRMIHESVSTANASSSDKKYITLHWFAASPPTQSTDRILYFSPSYPLPQSEG